jgi:cephalosporin hydroxylase
VEWGLAAAPYRYTYNFRWLGRPIIQLPQDIMAVQELIWEVKPDLVIETGIAHGGSLILSASMLQLIGGDGLVVGVDIDIRPHNRKAIEAHPMAHRIRMVQGSSIAAETFAEVQRLAEGRKRVMVMLDSNHTHEHVLEELRLYSRLVGRDSYLIVFDTAIDIMPDDAFDSRPWGAGNNPRSAVKAFLRENHRFAIDEAITDKLLITVAIDGYLRCLVDP